MSDEASPEAIAALQQQLLELNKLFARLKTGLEPVWDNERTLKDEIGATHGGPGKFDLAGAVARAPKFEGLIDSAAKHGPTKSEYKRVQKLMTAYTRDVAILEAQLARQKLKGK
jgi:hypothetical protein